MRCFLRWLPASSSYGLGQRRRTISILTAITLPHGPVNAACSCARSPEAGLRQRLLTSIRRDAPERYLIALDALDEAHEALSAYVSLDVLAAALTLRLRRG